MSTKKKKSRRLIFILLAVVVVLVVVASMSKKGKEVGTKVTVEEVKERVITETVSAAGRIFPEIEVRISSDVSGEIVALYVEEGDSVTQGQLLCKIKPDVYQSALERAVASQNSSKAQLANSLSQVKQVEAQLLQMQAQYDNAKTVHDRNTQLLKDGAIAQVEFDNSLASMKTANANIKSAEANIEAVKQSAEAARFGVKSAQATVKEATTNLSQTAIYAPTSGSISKLNVEKGERVVGTLQMSGTEILRIANMKFMEVQVDVSENDVLRVNVGDEADIEVDAYLGKKFTGTVMEIANTAQENAAGGFSSDQVTNFTVKVRVNRNSYKNLIQKNRKFPFRPGMSATVDIKTNTIEKALSLPVPAVTSREEKDDKKKKKDTNNDEVRTVVFIQLADSVSVREVSVGIQDDEYIQITKGLKKGETVVVGPYQEVARNLKTGDKVRVVEEKDLYGKKD
ncbi:MAG: efflux RND transporter periplasmic adaptor subunit [Saprospiraceae bacterium]